MTFNRYFMSKSVFMLAVLLTAFEFQIPPQTNHQDRRTQSAMKLKANECDF